MGTVIYRRLQRDNARLVRTRDALAASERSSGVLTPPALDDSSLPAALSRVCDSAGAQGRLAARFRVDGETYPLGVDVEIALLRVAQGALANVAQHANANTVVVTLSYLPEAVTLDVADDGIGFDPAVPCPDPDRGFGLRAIRQRIEALGGTTTIESSPGEGTMLAVSLPTQPVSEVDR